MGRQAWSRMQGFTCVSLVVIKIFKSAKAVIWGWYFLINIFWGRSRGRRAGTRRYFKNVFISTMRYRHVCKLCVYMSACHSKMLSFCFFFCFNKLFQWPPKVEDFDRGKDCIFRWFALSELHFSRRVWRFCSSFWSGLLFHEFVRLKVQCNYSSSDRQDLQPECWYYLYLAKQNIICSLLFKIHEVPIGKN